MDSTRGDTSEALSTTRWIRSQEIDTIYASLPGYDSGNNTFLSNNPIFSILKLVHQLLKLSWIWTKFKQLKMFREGLQA